MKPLFIILLILITLNSNADTLVNSHVLRFGGQMEERAQGMAVLNNGDYIITGYTFSDDLPCVGTAQTNHHNPQTISGYDQWVHADGYIARFDGTNHVLQWCTYLGGSNEDRAYQLMIDESFIYVTGITTSNDFDAIGNTTTNGHAIFLSKLSLDGQNIIYTTLIDGDDKEWIRNGITLSFNNSAAAQYVYLAGESASSTLLGSNLRGTKDGMVIRLQASDGSVINSIRIGGNSNDSAWGGIAIGANNDIYIAGNTESSDLLSQHLTPSVASTMAQTQFGGYQPANDWAGDGFVARISADLDNVKYITYLGGSRQDASSVNDAIAIDALGRAYVLLDTKSTNSNTETLFPLSGLGVEKTFHYPPHDLAGNVLSPGAVFDENMFDSVLVVLDADGRQILASTVVGGSRADESSGVNIDEDGRVWITGNTNSNDISTTIDALMGQYTTPIGPPQYPWFPDTEFGPDWLISAYSPDLSSLLFRSYLGGDGNILTGDAGRSIQLNSNLPNQIWVAGVTDTATNASTPFPVDNSIGTLGLPSDSVVLHLNTTNYNNAIPVVNAGNDQVLATLSLPIVVQLNGSATDTDGFLQTIWSVHTLPQGSGPIVFSAVNNSQSQITINTYGVYILRFTAKDGINTVYDEIHVSVVTEDLIFANGFD